MSSTCSISYCYQWPVWLCHIVNIISQMAQFLKNAIEHNRFLFFLQCLSEILLMLRRIQWVSMINVHSSSCKVTVIIVWLNKTWIFLTTFGKTLKYQISWKSIQREISCSTWTDRQFKAKSLFCNFLMYLKIGRDNWKLLGVRGIFASKNCPRLAWVSPSIPTTD